MFFPDDGRMPRRLTPSITHHEDHEEHEEIKTVKPRITRIARMKQQ